MSDIITYPENGITYDADDAAAWLTTRSSGLYSTTEDFTVTPSEKTTVQISAGQAWVHPSRWIGRSIVLKKAAALTLPDADANLPRIDRVVLRYDALARKTSLVALTGTPASSPTAPEITRSAQTYDLCLAEVARPAGSAAITTANITDTRPDAALCGLMRDSVDGSGFYNKTEADARFTLTAARIAAVLGFAPTPVQLPYSIVYDHSYDGTGDLGTESAPLQIPLAGDYDAIGVIRTQKAMYPDREEVTRQRVLRELVTHENASDSFYRNYIPIRGLPNSFVGADKVYPGVIATGGNGNSSALFLRSNKEDQSLELYWSGVGSGQPEIVLNTKGCQYHVFGILMDSSILPAAKDYTDIE